jgi:dolichol-phosphate mannosyltransferase
MTKISVIIPCYYNEQNIPITTKVLLENEKMFPESVCFEYVMVDDGSKDNTFVELLNFKNQYPQKVTVVKLSGNFGSYNAILAGMSAATGDCNIVITADLQDPPELMIKMYEYWLKGIKLVLANRDSRDEGFFSRVFSNSYHILLKKFALKNLPIGGFDYCLFDKKLKDEVLQMNEKNTNSLYLLVWLNYDFVTLPYHRNKRKIGTSKWTLSKKIKLFIDSFVSFSYVPLRFITISGLILGLISFIYALFIVYSKFFGFIDVQGWSTMMVVFLIISSFQMISLGIIGEYLWRNLEATRKRPSYVIDRIIK